MEIADRWKKETFDWFSRSIETRVADGLAVDIQREPRLENNTQELTSSSNVTPSPRRATHQLEVAVGSVAAHMHPHSNLYDLTVDMNWRKVLRACEIRPVDASYQDADLGETPLYVACQQRPPVRVVRALLRAFPQGAYVPSYNGDLPIHIACRWNASIEILRELVQWAPDTASQASKWGATALVALWDGRDVIDSNDAPENYNTVFWQKAQVILEAIAKSRRVQHVTRQDNGTSHGGSAKVNERSQKTAEAEPFVLHAAVSLGSLGCPYPILEYAIAKYSHQKFQRDESGKLPLHIAVGPTTWSKLSRRRYKPREQQVISKLLELGSDTALQIDPNEPSGRYPLHTALTYRHQWSGGVKDLFKHSPELILCRDPILGVYPFQLAAIPVGSSISTTLCTPDLATIYHLLRSHPAALNAPIARLASSEHIDTHHDDGTCLRLLLTPPLEPTGLSPIVTPRERRQRSSRPQRVSDVSKNTHSAGGEDDSCRIMENKILKPAVPVTTRIRQLEERRIKAATRSCLHPYTKEPRETRGCEPLSTSSAVPSETATTSPTTVTLSIISKLPKLTFAPLIASRMICEYLVRHARESKEAVAASCPTACQKECFCVSAIVIAGGFLAWAFVDESKLQSNEE